MFAKTPPPPAPCCPPQAAHTAAVVAEVSEEIRKVLQAHPINEERRRQGLNVANIVLLRGCPMCWLVGLFETMQRK